MHGTRIDQLADFPPFQRCASVIGASLERSLAENGESDDLEFEFRIGFAEEDGTFRSGLGREDFDKIRESMARYNGWEKAGAWTRKTDFFYKGISGAECRTRVGIDASGSRSIEHLQKTQEAVHHIWCGAAMPPPPLAVPGAGVVEPASPDPTGAPAARLCLSRERHLAKDVPASVDTTWVRIKDTVTFVYMGCGGSVPFSFDLSLVWEGVTRAAAECSLQRGDPPRCEVECECLAPREYVEKRSGHCSSLSLSLILKAHDIFRIVSPACPFAVSFLKKRQGTKRKKETQTLERS